MDTSSTTRTAKLVEQMLIVVFACALFWLPVFLVMDGLAFHLRAVLAGLVLLVAGIGWIVARFYLALTR